MKKLISILLISILLCTNYVYAEEINKDVEGEAFYEDVADDTSTENTETTSFSINLTIKPGFCHASESDATIKLSDGEKEYLKSIKISDELPIQTITFDVDAIDESKTFYLTPVTGISKLFSGEKEGSSSAPLQISSLETNIEYIPTVHNAIDIIINGTPTEFSVPARNIGLHVIVPFDEMTNSLSLLYKTQNGAYHIETPLSALTLEENGDAYLKRIFNDKVKIELPVAPQMISGKLFVPISLFETAYNLTLIQKTEGDKPDLYIGTAPVDNVYVNSKGLSSQTDYLIWVSKSEYKVRVYSGHKGNWNLINSFTCAIGAPRTPTCEGTYRYYQSHERWDYGSYYVGPIMRFNRGYAIHSTLIYQNGTSKDDRVGMKLSLGCVRLHPQDINWLHSIIPLYTTIHITG